MSHFVWSHLDVMFHSHALSKSYMNMASKLFTFTSTADAMATLKSFTFTLDWTACHQEVTRKRYPVVSTKASIGDLAIVLM